MQPGSVVEYLSGKELALGFCLEGENKGKLPIMTSSGRKESLASKKVLFSHQSPLSATASREEKLAHLESVEERKTRESEELDTAELWELLAAEEEGREWQLSELTGFLFSEAGAWEKSLVFRAVTNDRHRYSRKGDNFVLRSAEQVEEAMQREAVEARREVERAAVKEWMRTVWESRKNNFDPEYAESVEEWKERIRNVALHGEDASHFQHVQRYLKELDAKGLDVAFQFMVRLGEWTLDENLEILANQTPTVFSDEVLNEARQAGERLETVLQESDRVDLTEWPCHSIDDPDTTEIDDALSWRTVEGGYELAVHIADASALVTPDLENLEKEIRYRATSVYLPDFKVRMVPENLSDDALSLKQGVPRPAFTFLVKIDENGKLLESKIQTSVIKVEERLDYDMADQRVAEGQDYWSTLAEIAEKLKSQREANGAVNLPFPRMEVVLKGEEILLVPDERGSTSQTIVSEMMILANRVAAEYLRDNQLPAIYRSQKAPDPPIEMREEWRPHHLYEARRSFSRSAQGFEPSLHSGLGLDAYVQATSPIRRYRDLVLQRQIKHHLQNGETLYSKDDLEEILTITSTPVSQAEKMERNRKAYFLHKLLLKQRGKEVTAIVLAANGERYTLQLKDTLREVDVPQGGGSLKAPGEEVRVKVLSVYPRDRVVKVSSPL
ncbi:MAG: RNB domain-containing ribonuclease [Candidatus Eremiobacteraeota bacterium]|nr:RNB domain-containing ribonuclease [Candidatus Eremiobacteraeota bacterium]